MNALDQDGFPRAEEALRLLASAVGLARLYPEASNLPTEAAEKFTARANELTASAPLRFTVERERFRIGDTPIAAGQSQVVALAETLHAMQVGQLILVPGFTIQETMALVAIANSDPADVRARGGARNALVTAGVSHMALIEVSLRASEESGLLGLDPTTAPLEEIAPAVAEAVERRAAEAASGPANDDVETSISRLEAATRDIARERIASALLQLDEATRVRILSMALHADSNGRRMDGMLEVVAKMKPAALCRLLKLTAMQAGADPRRVAAALPLPPETAKLIGMLLTPDPVTVSDAEEEASHQHAEQLAHELAEPHDAADIERQVAVASATLSSARALSTSIAVSRTHTDPDTVRAMSDLLPRAAADGAFATVREALRRLDELSTDPAIGPEIAAAKMTLAEPSVLADVCRVPMTDADAAIAGEILQAAGVTGAEVLLDSYVRMGPDRQSLMRPALRGMSEPVLGVARERLRNAEPAVAVAILRALAALGDRRAVPVVADMLNHLDETVRFAAVRSLAAMQSAEAAAALTKAVNHREPETARCAVREIGAQRVASAVPALSRALEDINVFGRTYETRKDIIRALDLIGTPEAERALRAYAQHTVRLGRKTRELRNLAIAAADKLARDRGVSTP